MKNKANKPDYILFFGSNSIKGLEVMKEAMWKVDNLGGFQFSDATYNSNCPHQTVLFEPEPNYSILRKQILTEFKGKTVGIEEITSFVIIKTAFLRGHIRKPILGKLEAENPPLINVTRQQKRRPGTYPTDCRIQFL